MNAPTPEMTGETSLMIRRVFKAGIERVFDALTRPEALAEWMGAKMARPAEVTVDLQIGGKYAIRMIDSDGNEHNVGGEYLEIDRPNRVSFTWAWASTPDRISRVEYALRASGDGETTLTLTHERLFDQDARDRHGKGWTASLDSLDAHLAA